MQAIFLTVIVTKMMFSKITVFTKVFCLPYLFKVLKMRQFFIFFHSSIYNRATKRQGGYFLSWQSGLHFLIHLASEI